MKFEKFAENSTIEELLIKNKNESFYEKFFILNYFFYTNKNLFCKVKLF